MRRIYLSPPHVGPRERELLLEAFDSNWIAPLGPYVDRFEAAMVEHLGGGHAAALSSGTAALHLALVLLDVGPGDRVVTSTLTFAATANAIRYVGATPVFVDVHPHTWTLDPDRLRQALDDAAARRQLPKAVIAVDLYGQCADYDALREACGAYGIPLIEDAAEALGATYRGAPAGTLADLGVFSFNGNKIITTSGGGMLVSAREDWIRRARHLATQARSPVAHYEHEEVGYNYRLSNLLAALGVAQLESLEAKVEARRANREMYRALLAGAPGVALMPEAPYGRASFWLTCVTIDPVRFGADREQVRLHLEAHDIEARPVWKPMHQQPVFRSCDVVGGEVADDLFARGLCLPSGSGLTAEDQDRIAAALRTVPRR